eukprot:gene4512-8553_t
MGVCGLTGYVTHHAGMFQTVEFRPSDPQKPLRRLVVDGHSIVYKLLHEDATAPSASLHEQVTAFQEALLFAINAFLACFQEVIMIFDGPYPSYKSSTQDQRLKQLTKQKISSFRSLISSSAQESGHPIVSALRNLQTEYIIVHTIQTILANYSDRVLIAHSVSEGDALAAALCQSPNAYLLALDSDFFVYSCQYIPSDMCIWSCSDQVIHAQLFSRSRLIQSLSLTTHFELCIWATLIGNDYTKEFVPKVTRQEAANRIAQATCRFSNADDLTQAAIKLLLPRAHLSQSQVKAFRFSVSQYAIQFEDYTANQTLCATITPNSFLVPVHITQKPENKGKDEIGINRESCQQYSEINAEMAHISPYGKLARTKTIPDETSMACSKNITHCQLWLALASCLYCHCQHSGNYLPLKLLRFKFHSVVIDDEAPYDDKPIVTVRMEGLLKPLLDECAGMAAYTSALPLIEFAISRLLAFVLKNNLVSPNVTCLQLHLDLRACDCSGSKRRVGSRSQMTEIPLNKQPQHVDSSMLADASANKVIKKLLVELEDAELLQTHTASHLLSYADCCVLDDPRQLNAWLAALLVGLFVTTHPRSAQRMKFFITNMLYCALQYPHCTNTKTKVYPKPGKKSCKRFKTTLQDGNAWITTVEAFSILVAALGETSDIISPHRGRAIKDVTSRLNWLSMCLFAPKDFSVRSIENDQNDGQEISSWDRWINPMFDK